MRRGIMRTATAGSLALWLAALGCWASSYSRPFFAAGRIYRFQSIDGVLRVDNRSGYAIFRRAQLQRRQAIEQYNNLQHAAGRDGPAPIPVWMSRQIESRPAAAIPARWSVRYAALVVPASGLVASCLLLELAMRRRRLRLSRAGVCAGCGYDLRATPSRCPECGRPAGPSHQGLSH